MRRGEGEAVIMRRAIVMALFCTVAALGCRTRSGDPATQEAATENAKPTNVVMAINLGEEDEEGGCGDVIHAVRAAAKTGVRTREVDTRNRAEMDAASKKYRIVVQPTVILFDDADKEVRRYEGESKETITALKTDLDLMAKK